jgi:3-oxoacyl-[acyl-carrier-protein] synthase II
MTGHLLGAAGGIESVVCVKSIQTQCLAPTINLEDQDPECDLDYVPNTARSSAVKTVMSNNLGFGGQNSAVVFRAL